MFLLGYLVGLLIAVAVVNIIQDRDIRRERRRDEENVA